MKSRLFGRVRYKIMQSYVVIGWIGWFESERQGCVCVCVGVLYEERKEERKEERRQPTYRSGISVMGR